MSSPNNDRRGLMFDLGLAVRLWPFMASDRWALLGTLIFYLGNAACIVLPPYVMQQMLDGAIARRDMHWLAMLAWVYLVTLVLEYVLGFLSEYAMSVLGQRALTKLRFALFAHTQRLSISFFDANPTGKIQTRLTNDVEALNEIFATGVISMLSDLLSVIGVAGMMFALNVKLTLATFGIVPVLVAVAIGFQRFARRAFVRIRGMLGRINGFMAEHVAAMSAVQAFGQQKRTQSEFRSLNAAYRDANRDAIFADAALYAIVEAIGTFAVAALLMFGAFDLSHGTISAGVLVAFIQYIRRFYGPIRDLSTKYTVLQSAFTAAERVFDLLDTKVTITDGAGAQTIKNMQSTLELRDVSFSYVLAAKGQASSDEAEPQAQPPDEILEPHYSIKNISLSIRRGESIGLVGATGSGKSTLIKLLNRTYDVHGGQVLIDGVDVRQLKIKDVRQLYAVVQQDATLLSGTLAQNLQISARISREDAEAALEVVQATSWMRSLPKGLDTEVLALGTNFSHGQRQVLALARAVATGAQIILMDEATSHIDSQTEAQIQHALDALLAKRTAVVVAHRLSTLARVDRIVVLERGRIVESGTHKELLSHKGRYRDFVRESERMQSQPKG